MDRTVHVGSVVVTAVTVEVSVKDFGDRPTKKSGTTVDTASEDGSPGSMRSNLHPLSGGPVVLGIITVNINEVQPKHGVDRFMYDSRFSHLMFDVIKYRSKSFNSKQGYRRGGTGVGVTNSQTP